MTNPPSPCHATAAGPRLVKPVCNQCVKALPLQSLLRFPKSNIHRECEILGILHRGSAPDALGEVRRLKTIPTWEEGRERCS